MKKYYFLATSLPKLEIGAVPEISFQELETLLKENLSDSDLRKVQRLRNWYDLLNIRALWSGETLDYWGNLDAAELEEELLTHEQGVFPPFLATYMNEYDNREDRLKHFPKVLKNYFEDVASHSSGFLKWFVKFERDLRLVLASFRARQLHRNLSEELQYEDPEENLVAQLLAQKDAKSFEPPVGYEDLKDILEKNYKAPLELQKALTEYRFNKIEDMLTFDPFSIERVLGYIVQYMMVDKWLHYDQQKGMEIVDKLTEKRS